jgi:hypothetical protein
MATDITGQIFSKSQDIKSFIYEEQNKSGVFESFKNYVNAIHAKRVESVIYKSKLKDNFNQQPTLKLPNMDILDDYPVILDEKIPERKITNVDTINDNDSIFNNKYKELNNFVYGNEQEIITRHKGDNILKANLLNNTIADLIIICNQMSNIIGFNTNFSTEIAVKSITNISEENKDYQGDVSNDTEIQLEREIFDAIINIQTPPSNFVENKDNFIFSYPFNDIIERYTEANKIDNSKLKYDGTTFISGKYSLMDQIYLLKYLETEEQRIKLDEALTKGAQQFQQNTADLFNMKIDEYQKFERDCGHLFKAGMRYKKNTKNNNEISLVKGYKYINNTYSSSKIFCKDYPIIQNILESYLPPQQEKEIRVTEDGQDIVKRVQDTDAPLDFSKSYITDFKVFYLFANYDKKNEGLGKLKCKNQYDLLENTLGFIEAIYK